MTLQLNSKMLRLALFALVCMVALQTLEVSHDHTDAGAVFECQVCSSSAGIALPAPAAVAPAIAPVGYLREQSRLAGFTSTFATFNPRAPPTVS